METKYCRVCERVLTDENWSSSAQKYSNYICNNCRKEQNRLWAEENHEKSIANNTRRNRKNGMLPMSENKDCALYLGVCVTEELLAHIFKDVVRMPNGNQGFDFICNKGMRVDSKGSCLTARYEWTFHINRNKIADYFVFVAFDNREDLNVLHAWLIPGDDVNMFVTKSIRPSTIHKLDQYKLDVTKISACCDTMKISDQKV